MPNRNILRQAGTAGLQNFPNAAGIVHNSTDGFIAYDSAGSTKTVVNAEDAQTISGVKTFSATPVMSGDGGIRFAEVTVSSAELLALAAAPKTLVAAPGAGKMLWFISALIIADNGTAYTITNAGDDLAIRYKDGSGDIISATVDTAGLIDTTSDVVTQVMPLITDSKSPKADVENQPLVLDNIGAAEFTLGTGVLRVKIFYSVVTTGW